MHSLTNLPWAMVSEPVNPVRLNSPEYCDPITLLLGLIRYRVIRRVEFRCRIIGALRMGPVYGACSVRYHNTIHGYLSKQGAQVPSKSGRNYVTQIPRIWVCLLYTSDAADE